MLSKLVIENYVLIEHLEMEPSPHLSIITGETGAGKSIMLGAVGLLLGNRVDTKVLLNKSKKCFIEGTFDVSEYSMEYLFEANDLDYDSTTLIRREISPSGKSRAFVNDTPVRLEVLREIGEKLINVHSQTDTFNLGEQKYQLKLLDSYAQNAEIGRKYQQSYYQFVETEATWKELIDRSNEIQKDLDYFQFMHTELENLTLDPGEQEELESELKILEHAEEIKSSLFQINEILSESTSGALTQLFEASSFFKKIVSFSPSYQQLADRLESNFIDISDLQREIEAEAEQVQFEPQLADKINERLSEIYRLQHKHKVKSIAELLQIQADLSQKLLSASNFEKEIEEAEKRMRAYEKDTHQNGQALTASRKNVAEELCAKLMELLVDLSIPDALVQLDFEDTEPGPSGMDHLSVRFSANKGVAAEPLKKVASGGEFSRLMFAVKYLMAGRTSLPTIIFDEIDTGISGEIAKRLGMQMKTMGENHQIITITHLPQIAALGESHYFAYKLSNEESTASHIRLLTKEERIDEIAKMIAGDNPSTSALQSARELVNS